MVYALVLVVAFVASISLPLLFFSLRRIRYEVGIIDPPEVPIEEKKSLPPIFVSTKPSTQLQQIKSMSFMVIMAVVFAVLYPFASIPLPIVDVFTPTVDAIFVTVYFVISMVLIGQFIALRSMSLLILIICFFFQAIMALCQAIAYPGYIFADGIFGYGTATSGWIFIIWHLICSALFMTYAAYHFPSNRLLLQKPIGSVILATVGCVALSTIIFFAIIYFNHYLPITYTVDNSLIGDDRQRVELHLARSGISPLMLIFGVASLVCIRLSGSTVLDLWLEASAVASIFDVIASSIITAHRYDLGFYLGRCYSLASVMVIFVPLMFEMNRLYGNLFALMRRQREDGEARYKAIVDTATDAMIVINKFGTIQSFNHAAVVMFGYSIEEIIGKNVRVLMPEPYSNEHDQYLENYRETHKRKIIGIGRQVQAKNKLGSIFPVDLTIAEWYNGDEQQFTGIIRDISERKSIESQLIHSQKMEAVGQLTGGIAHDFNNILAVVIGNLDLLSETYDKVPDELKEALSASESAALLIQRLLAFARRQPLQPKLIYVNAVIELILPLLERIVGGALIKITVESDSKLLPILADVTQLENVIFNLVINARDAMKKGGKLLIECRTFRIDDYSAEQYDVPKGVYTVLIITDTGVGIPKHILPHVFEPFFTTKPVGEGSGLGLSMVFGYTKQSGGVARIYSEVGVGTSIRLYFPAEKSISANVEEDEENDLEVELASLHGTERILVVEDSLSARIVANRVLSSLGYTVTVVENAAQAIATMEEGETYDLLFTDIIMPGNLDGTGLARIIKKRYPNTKLILVSGFSITDPIIVKELNAGYIVKPYRKLDLAKLLRKMFEPVERQ